MPNFQWQSNEINPASLQNISLFMSAGRGRNTSS